MSSPESLGQEQEEIVESDNPEIKPAGKVTYIDGKKYVGGWKVDDEGYFLSPSDTMDAKTFERLKEIDRRTKKE